MEKDIYKCKRCGARIEVPKSQIPGPCMNCFQILRMMQNGYFCFS